MSHFYSPLNRSSVHAKSQYSGRVEATVRRPNCYPHHLCWNRSYLTLGLDLTSIYQQSDVWSTIRAAIAQNRMIETSADPGTLSKPHEVSPVSEMVIASDTTLDRLDAELIFYLSQPDEHISGEVLAPNPVRLAPTSTYEEVCLNTTLGQIKARTDRSVSSDGTRSYQLLTRDESSNFEIGNEMLLELSNFSDTAAPAVQVASPSVSEVEKGSLVIFIDQIDEESLPQPEEDTPDNPLGSEYPTMAYEEVYSDTTLDQLEAELLHFLSQPDDLDDAQDIKSSKPYDQTQLYSSHSGPYQLLTQDESPNFEMWNGMLLELSKSSDSPLKVSQHHSPLDFRSRSTPLNAAELKDGRSVKSKVSIPHRAVTLDTISECDEDCWSRRSVSTSSSSGSSAFSDESYFDTHPQHQTRDVLSDYLKPTRFYNSDRCVPLNRTENSKSSC